MSGPPFTVKAVFEYTSEHEDDLTFSIGQIITVTEEEDAEWFFGTYTDDKGSKHEGIFPRNFVEKYDPPAPPRPSRPSRSKKEAETTSHVPDQPAADTVATAPRKSTDLGRADIEAKPVEHEVPVQEAPPAPATATAISPLPSPPAQEPVQRVSPPVVQKAEAPKTEKPSEKPSKKPPPPAVAEKPSGGSFKDRIAAFNKASAAPMPFNPGAHQTSANNFVKKPFVAPPPSKNAYVPLPAEKPQTIYRREEDQTATEHQTQGNVVTERSQPTVEPSESGEEDQPKPTSLKERIALLQKQQLEQAARHAEAAQKKEKPKKPQKKKVEQQDTADQANSSQSLELQRTETSETAKQEAEAESHAENIPHRQRPPPPVTQPPARELTSDTNDADYSGAGDTEEADETSTSKEDFDERPAKSSHQEHPPAEHRSVSDKEENDNGDGDESGDEAAEDEEIDPEIKRRMELRERMAKISGGMGMMGMFGAPPGGMPGMPGMPTGNYKKPKPPTPGAEASEQPSSPTMQAPPVPLMALPGMHSTKPQEPPQSQAKTAEEHGEHDEEDQVADKSQGSPVEARHGERSSTDNIAESRPSTSNDTSMPTTANINRPVPPPVTDRRTSIPPPPLESRPVPAPPTQTKTSPGTDDESDGEIPGPAFSREPKSESQQESPIDNLPSGRPTTGSEKRSSLGQPPPLPPLASPPLPAPAQSRPPPPPPPVPVSRKSTSDSRISARTPTPLSGHNSEDEVTEYEGDYDTDIASSAKHKDALKAHGRNSSVDEGTITDEVSGQSPKSPIETRPPIPSTLPPRGMPPPPPSQPPKPRQSSDMPRGPPPPIPPPKDPQDDGDAGEDEYDPFRHDTRPSIMSRDSNNSRAEESPTLGENQFQPSSARHSFLPQPPPPPPSQPPGQPPRTPGRQSVDLLRGQGGSRRSMDVSRPSMDLGHIASDVDLGQGTLWWTQPNTPPPAFQNRRDVLFEIEESSSPNQGGQTTVSKDVYVLFMDYSQTIVSVQFDAQNPQDAMLEQRHEPPPPRLRQDQLENAHSQFGTRISEGVASVQNTVIGDGTPHGLIQSLLAPFSDALKPVGVRAYGALVYTNLANASVQQYDEIRPGDIITFRNSRFQGHRGTMHQKYSTDAGKPDHVGVVYDWDGTKKKLRVWEQGRESKKVKVESFKLNDLRSGECRIWRVMPRSWIGWDGGHKA